MTLLMWHACLHAGYRWRQPCGPLWWQGKARYLRNGPTRTAGNVQGEFECVTARFTSDPTFATVQ
jgi:hypothetical protein